MYLLYHLDRSLSKGKEKGMMDQGSGDERHNIVDAFLCQDIEKIQKIPISPSILHFTITSRHSLSYSLFSILYSLIPDP
jgi:hypothetical protein